MRGLRTDGSRPASVGCMGQRRNLGHGVGDEELSRTRVSCPLLSDIGVQPRWKQCPPRADQGEGRSEGRLGASSTAATGEPPPDVPLLRRGRGLRERASRSTSALMDASCWARRKSVDLWSVDDGQIVAGMARVGC